MATDGWGKQGTWEETENFLGKVIGVSVGADAVELGSIRKWLEPKEFYAPIHSDEKAAVEAGFKDIVAPHTMVFTYGLPAYFTPEKPLEKMGDTPRQIPVPVIFDVPAPCKLSFATSIDIEFYEDMYVGDKISCTHKLIDITHKTLSVGEGAFLTQEDTYVNQKGDKVARVLLVIFRFNPPVKE